MSKVIAKRLMDRMYEHEYRKSKLRETDFEAYRKPPIRIIEAGGVYCSLIDYNNVWKRGKFLDISRDKTLNMLSELQEQVLLDYVQKFEQSIRDVTPRRKPRSPEAIEKARHTRARNKLKKEIEALKKEIIEAGGEAALRDWEDKNDNS